MVKSIPEKTSVPTSRFDEAQWHNFNRVLRQELTGIYPNARTEVLQAISLGLPILIPGNRALGDRLIHRYAAYTAIRKLLDEQDLSRPFSLAERDFASTKISNIEANPTASLYDPLSRCLHIIAEDQPSMHAYDQSLSVYASILGVDLEESDRLRIPKPVVNGSPYQALNQPPFDLYNKKVSADLTKRFRRSGHDRKRIVVFRSGSMPEKRFADRQIRQICSTVKSTDQNAFVVVLDDSALSGSVWDDIAISNGWDPDFFTEALSTNPFPEADITEKPTDINEICAHFAAADQIIGTDSFWGWLSASNLARPENEGGILDPNKLLLLYTVARLTHYSIPGAFCIESPTLQEAEKWKKNGQDVFEETFMPMLSSRTYHKLADDFSSGITQADIDFLVSKIPEFVNSS